MTEAIIHGFLLALGLILPLGVQNVFIMNQGMNHSRLRQAMPAVITAALCDTLLVLAAVSGISVIVMKWVGVNMVLLGAGSLFLIYMGWSLWKSDYAAVSDPSASRGYGWRKQVAFAASVSLLNPHAIMDTIGVIGTTSVSYLGQEKTAFTWAVVAVSWLWFLGLAAVGHGIGNVSWARNKLKGINRCSALILWGTAVYMAWKLYNLY